MSDSIHDRGTGGLRDLVPWADPYIAALIEKLRRCSETDLDGPSLADESPWRRDARRRGWSPRSWPRD
jgi:hypothetical protein